MYTYDFIKTESGYFVKLMGTSDWIPVTKEVYTELTQSVWREEKAEQRYSTRNFSLNYEYGSGCRLEDFLPGKHSLDPEEIFEHEEFLSEVWGRIHTSLSNTELEILNFLVIGEFTESEYAALTGIPRSTVGYRKRKLLKKLRSLFEDFD